MPQKLNDESIQGWLRSRKGWKREDDALYKEWRFDSFRNSIVFVNRVAGVADDVGHMPEIHIRGSKVRLTLRTPRRGVTDKDLELAERLDFATSAR